MLRAQVKQKRDKTRVVLQLEGRSAIDGYMFKIPGERLIDLLNDERGFLPIELLSGDTVMVRKTNIQLVEQSSDDGQINSIFSGRPNDIFEVRDDTNPEELKAKLESMLKNLHPEIVAKADLHPALTDCARMLTTRLIASYRKALDELTRRKIRSDIVQNTDLGCGPASDGQHA